MQLDLLAGNTNPSQPYNCLLTTNVEWPLYHSKQGMRHGRSNTYHKKCLEYTPCLESYFAYSAFLLLQEQDITTFKILILENLELFFSKLNCLKRGLLL